MIVNIGGNSKIVRSILSNAGMTDYEKYCLCYEASEFSQCADIVHRIIDDRTYNGVHLPFDYRATIELFVTALAKNGFAHPTIEEFQKLTADIEKAFVEGPGNPTVNN